MDNYIWYVFSNNILSCDSGVLARRKFDIVSKDLIDIFVYKGVLKNGFPEYLIEKVKNFDIKNLTSKYVDFFDAIEVYVVDKKNNWCYVRTHKNNFGPYFYDI